MVLGFADGDGADVGDTRRCNRKRRPWWRATAWHRRRRGAASGAVECETGALLCDVAQCDARRKIMKTPLTMRYVYTRVRATLVSREIGGRGETAA
jgi:hypothetical protein